MRLNKYERIEILMMIVHSDRMHMNEEAGRLFTDKHNYDLLSDLQ